MNLIEQLGGYEKAKRELQLKEQNSVLQCCASVTANMIRSAMLEYRRQHNIFEVGDKVVHIDDPEKQSVMTVFDENDLEVWVNDGCRITRCNLRHATDEEIKAGKRL